MPEQTRSIPFTGLRPGPEPSARLRRRRVLFVGEAFTLSHVVRPLALAAALDPERFEVHFATGGQRLHLAQGQRLLTHRLDCLASAELYRRIAAGKPLYSVETLRHYVKQELALFARIAPDIVVGDLRLSLPVSCGLANLPHVNLVNAYWSPHAVQPFPIPDMWFTRLAGRSASRAIVRGALALHARVHQRLRREWGLEPVTGLMDAYTRATWTVYPDLPELVPTADLPPNHCYLGPILWEPPIALDPELLCRAEGSRAYVAVGAGTDLQAVAEAGARAAGCSLLTATADRLLPGIQAARHSQVVVCHGGSGTVYQALSQGVPIVGLVGNPDQTLSMQAVERAQAGIALTARTATKERVAAAVRRVLADPSYGAAAGRLMKKIHATDARQDFAALLERVLPADTPPAEHAQQPETNHRELARHVRPTSRSALAGRKALARSPSGGSAPAAPPNG